MLRDTFDMVNREEDLIWCLGKRTEKERLSALRSR